MTPPARTPREVLLSVAGPRRPTIGTAFCPWCNAWPFVFSIDRRGRLTGSCPSAGCVRFTNRPPDELPPVDVLPSFTVLPPSDR